MQQIAALRVRRDVVQLSETFAIVACLAVFAFGYLVVLVKQGNANVERALLVLDNHTEQLGELLAVPPAATHRGGGDAALMEAIGTMLEGDRQFVQPALPADYQLTEDEWAHWRATQKLWSVPTSSSFDQAVDDAIRVTDS